MRVRVSGNGTDPGSGLWLWCSGCEDSHRIVFGTPNGWTWDGNTEAPTISPSILVHGTKWPEGYKFSSNTHADVAVGEQTTCHSFVVAGVWQFLGDCTHELAGQHVPMVDLPDWLSADYVSEPS